MKPDFCKEMSDEKFKDCQLYGYGGRNCGGTSDSQETIYLGSLMRDVSTDPILKSLSIPSGYQLLLLIKAQNLDVI